MAVRTLSRGTQTAGERVSGSHIALSGHLEVQLLGEISGGPSALIPFGAANIHLSAVPGFTRSAAKR